MAADAVAAAPMAARLEDRSAAHSAHRMPAPTEGVTAVTAVTAAGRPLAGWATAAVDYCLAVMAPEAVAVAAATLSRYAGTARARNSTDRVRHS